jgi:hypothetical protein
VWDQAHRQRRLETWASTDIQPQLGHVRGSFPPSGVFSSFPTLTLVPSFQPHLPAFLSNVQARSASRPLPL